jgi:phosphoglucosamine mutase
MMGKLFGTDGIRGKANRYPITPEIAMKVGRAIASFFKEGEGIVIGRDPRISGEMIESALIAGICSMGVNAYRAGVVPTPAVAFLAKKDKRCCGVVISASHNPYYDNGIKLFKGDGFKLSDEEENGIEELIFSDKLPEESENIENTGVVIDLKNPCENYVKFLTDAMEVENFNALKLVVDCSNGATSEASGLLFSQISKDCEIIFASPDGININDGCGSQYTSFLKQKVIENGASLGLAFDGDGDRLIALDHEGNVVTGDQIIAICAKYMHGKKTLENSTVVTTVMSNIGFVAAMRDLGIKHEMADVGDRFVLRDMIKHGAVIGGEDSGHMIFLDNHTTGDGMLSAIKLLEIITESDRSLKELAKVMKIYPQVLMNVEVSSKPDVFEIPEIAKIINDVEQQLGQDGRVLVRYSGTQSLCRVMVEGPSEELTKDCCNQIVSVVEKVIGNN